MFEASHVERVIRHLVRFGSSRADAEDLAQEALVIAWRKQREHDRDRSLDAWLYGIARNVYRNHVRSQRRHPMTDEPAEPTADARDLADALAFRDALAGLPEAQQDIVILHELEEYTLKETAELLAIPFDTAKDRLRRARDGLRGTLDAGAASERRRTSQIAKAAAPAVALAVLAVLSRDAAAAGAAASGSSAAAGAAKLLLVAAVGVGIGVIVDRVVARHAESPRPVAAAPRPAAVAAAPPPVDASVAPDVAPPPTPAPRPVVPRATPPDAAPSDDTATAEAQLIERARVALHDGAPMDAVRTLMGHARRFPSGQLAEEREILLVEAYLAAGQLDLARERLADYRAAYPHGMHAQRAADAAKQLGVP
jgi:RNA polymerase sigma-70 factor (ECF subfamily)